MSHRRRGHRGRRRGPFRGLGPRPGPATRPRGGRRRTAQRPGRPHARLPLPRRLPPAELLAAGRREVAATAATPSRAPSPSWCLTAATAFWALLDNGARDLNAAAVGHDRVARRAARRPRTPPQRSDIATECRAWPGAARHSTSSRPRSSGQSVSWSTPPGPCLSISELRLPCRRRRHRDRFHPCLGRSSAVASEAPPRWCAPQRPAPCSSWPALSRRPPPCRRHAGSSDGPAPRPPTSATRALATRRYWVMYFVRARRTRVCSASNSSSSRSAKAARLVSASSNHSPSVSDFTRLLRVITTSWHPAVRTGYTLSR